MRITIRNNFINFDQPKIKPELLEKMFYSIGQNINDFFIINIDVDKKVLPKKFNLATAYAAGIAKINVIITVPIETIELV